MANRGQAQEAELAEHCARSTTTTLLSPSATKAANSWPGKARTPATIAALTWTRTLNDRIGISHEEKERKATHPGTSNYRLQETLLADRPEHPLRAPAADRMPADNPWGFRMPVPELLYNKGELYNLGVARGTLSEEERYKINEHIVQTLIMLRNFPSPSTCAMCRKSLPATTKRWTAPAIQGG
jgi:hypothetical protein